MARRKLALVEGPLTEVGERAAKDRAKMFASPKEGLAFIDSLPDEFQECRTDGHQWRPWTIGRPKPGVIERTQRCLNCHSLHNTWLRARDGMVLVGSPTIRYAPGYLAPRGMGRLPKETRGALRLQAIRRDERRLVSSKRKA
jgi:hypothetical protein